MNMIIKAEFKDSEIGKVTLLEDKTGSAIEMPALAALLGFVATTGVEGSGNGQDSRAVLSLAARKASNWSLQIKDNDGIVHTVNHPQELTIVVGGDQMIMDLGVFLGAVAKDLAFLDARSTLKYKSAPHSFL